MSGLSARGDMSVQYCASNVALTAASLAPSPVTKGLGCQAEALAMCFDLDHGSSSITRDNFNYSSCFADLNGVTSTRVPSVL